MSIITAEELAQLESYLPMDASHLDTVLTMLTNDIQEIKQSIKAHQIDTKDEFRRVKDKMDELNQRFADDSKSSAVNMKEIETRQQESAKFAGRIAGAISGFITALVTSLVAVLLKFWISGTH